SASAHLDLRALPDGEDELWGEIRRLAGDDIDLDWDMAISPIASPVDAPFVDTIRAALVEEDPDGVVVPFLLPASTDNKHFSRLGVRGYGFVPLRVPDDFDVYGQFHAADERVPVDALRFAARTTRRILTA